MAPTPEDQWQAKALKIDFQLAVAYRALRNAYEMAADLEDFEDEHDVTRGPAARQIGALAVTCSEYSDSLKRRF